MFTSATAGGGASLARRRWRMCRRCTAACV